MLNSPIEIAMVFGVALLVFGPKKLPELGRSLGQGIGNFKRSLQNAQDEVKNAMNTEEKAQAPDNGASLQPTQVASDEAPKAHGGSCCGGHK